MRNFRHTTLKVCNFYLTNREKYEQEGGGYIDPAEKRERMKREAEVQRKCMLEEIAKKKRRQYCQEQIHQERVLRSYPDAV